MDGEPHGDDRRANGRVRTSRRAWIRRRRHAGPGFEARVIDIAPAGLRFECTVPLQPGDEIDIEVHPREDDGAILEVRGTVRHASPAKEGNVAGVQLLVTLGLQESDAPSIDEVRLHLEALRRALDGLPAQQLSSLTFTASTEEPESPPERSTPRRRRWPLVALLMALLFLLTWPATRGLLDVKGSTPWNEWFQSVAIPSQTGSTSEAKLESSEPVEFDSEDTGWRANAYNELSGHVVPGESPDLADMDFADLWLLARLRESRGQVSESMQLLGKLRDMESRGEVPEAWKPQIDALGEALLRGQPNAPSLEIPMPALSWDAEAPEQTLPAQRDTANAAPAATQQPLEPLEELPSVRIVVDTTQHTLYVWRDGQLAAAYPAGVGEGERTPRGEFHINRKIYKPDWYDRGRTVPHGDPENPLGDYWIGIAGAPEAVGIGIHPTTEEGTIGGRGGRGCIRLFPSDAAALFDTCEVGTVVVIQ